MKRVEWIDCAAGLMIAVVILNHCMALAGASWIWVCLLGFRMPWFFYKAGMFYKPSDFKAQIIKDIKKLVVPFPIYSVIGFAVWATTRIIEYDDNLPGLIVAAYRTFLRAGCILGNDPLWFLITMFLIRQIVNVLFNKNIHPLIVGFGAYLIGYGLSMAGWQNLSWWFGNMFTGLSFFAFGKWLKDKQANGQVVVCSTALYAIFIILWLIGTCEFPYLYTHANVMQTGNYLLYLPVALAGIIITNTFFERLQPHLKFRVLTYIGRNAMDFFVIHWILLTLVQFIARYCFGCTDSNHMLVIMIASCVVLLPIIVWLKNKIEKSIKKEI